jgi:regulator of protease activity HflC (stomatin/prohibitin superfamily)
MTHTITFPTLIGSRAVLGPAEWSLGLWLCLALLGLALAVGAFVRVVPRHQRIVISRWGRISRVRGPGLVPVLPGVESATTVSLRTVQLPLTVSAMTRDGIPVNLVAAVAFRINAPDRAASSADPVADTMASIEQALAGQVGRTDLPALLLVRERWEERLPGEVTGVAQRWGTEVTEVTVRDIETQVSADMLRAAGQRPVDRVA